MFAMYTILIVSVSSERMLDAKLDTIAICVDLYVHPDVVDVRQEAVDKMQQKLEELQREILEVTEPQKETEFELEGSVS